MARGIYSTALLNLALKTGMFEVVSPTASQKTRFSLADNSEDPDITVTDTTDRHAVKILGEEQSVQEFVSQLRRVDDYSAVWWKSGDRSSLCIAAFSLKSKLALDSLRGEVTYTVPWHHYCRSGSESLSLCVTLAEKLVEENLAEPERVKLLFQQEMEKLTPRLGSLIRIVHTKLSGKVISLSPGKVVWRRGSELRIVRQILGGGVYDGLNVQKSPGDYAITHIKRGQPFMITKYYSHNGVLKGEYYNVSTPVEVYDSYIRYIDLSVDVVRLPDGTLRIIDREELDEAFSMGVISERMYREALETSRGIVKMLG